MGCVAGRDTMRPAPPRIPRAIVAACTGDALRDDVLEHLDQEFTELAEVHGRARAVRWYWIQSLMSAPALALDRRRSAGSSHDQPGGDAVRTRFSEEVRHAVRRALRRPAPTIPVVASVALGVAATSAVF